jgi:protein-S-isoprenylcysteine O-methyltransferase Ste14
MRATDFEFRHRFFFIVAIFALAFLTYKFDHVTAVVALGRLFAGRSLGMSSLAVRHGIQALIGVSATLVIAAAWVRTWGSAYLRAEVVQDTKVHTEKLVADGPFRYVRNPLYFGNLLMAAGIGLLSSRTGWFLLVIGNILFLRRLIGREEAALLETQGEGYGAYLAAVPRLWPSLVPRVPAGVTQPKWPQALLGEGWLWILGLDGLILAWKLNIHLYGRIGWLCAAAYFLRWLVLTWRRRRNPLGNA